MTCFGFEHCLTSSLPLSFPFGCPHQIPGNEEDDDASPASSPEEELARRFKDVMRRIFWDRFTQSLLPPPDADAATATTVATNAGGRGVQEDDEGQHKHEADVVAQAEAQDGVEVEVEVPGLPHLRVGSKVHARYGSERGSYYVATVLAVAVKHKEGKGNKSEQASQSQSSQRGAGSRCGAPSAAAAAAAGDGGGAVEAGGDGGGSGVFVDIRYDEDGMVERGIPVSRLKKSDDPPDFGPLLSLLGEVREVHEMDRVGIFV